MKKIGIILVAIVVLLVVVVLGLSLSLNSAIKAGVTTLGPKMTKTSVELQAVDISILSGTGEIKQLLIGNPEGYQTAYAMRLGSVQVAMDPMSVFSDRIVVKEIVIDSPEVTFEAEMKGNNISQIKKNIEAFAGPQEAKGEAPSQKEGAGKKLQIDDIRVTNGKINLSGMGMQGKTITVPLQDIHLSDIGKDSGGASIPVVTEKIFLAVNQGVLKAVAQSGYDISKGVEEVKKKGEAVKEEAGGIVKGLKGIFEKKD